MVQITSFIGAVAIFSTLASAAPSYIRPRQDDSAIGLEVGVSAPDGVPITNSVELASQAAREAGQTGVAPQVAVTTSAAVTTATGAASVSSSAYVTSSSAYATYSSSSAYNTYSSSAYVTTSAAHTTVTSSAHATTSAAHSALPTYGSGGSSWGKPGYEDCVQQCVAKYGASPAKYVPTATNSASYGTGATHTVIVAPTQGVLRYIPFAVNATVGDTIKFMWGANNHTVTKASALQPCNRTGDALFASGVQNQNFVFTQIVNDTNPTYFHCATPGHCQKGMFGIINPATKFSSPTSVSQKMQDIAANSSTVQGYAAWSKKQTEGNKVAANWGGNIDLASMPEWAYEAVAENVLYTRSFLAANPEVIKEDGSIDLSSATSTPLAIPQDVATVISNAQAPVANTAPVPTSSADAAPETTGTTSNLNSGALSGASPRVLVAAMAVFATFALL